MATDSAQKTLDEYNIRQKYPARLQTLCAAWTKKWEGPLAHTQALAKLWASGYFDKGYGRWHLVNLMNRGISTVVAFLCEGNPKVLIEPRAPKLNYYTRARQLIFNYLIDKNNFADEVLIPGATASLVGDAIARTFFEYDRVISKNGEVIKVGTPKVAIIEPVDYIGDPSAKKRGDFAIEGDTYRLPTEYAKDLFAKKDKSGRQVADFITADCKLATKYSNEEIATKGGFDFNRLAEEEFTTFIDVYQRKEGIISTIMPMGRTAIILKEIEWDGPGEGPYDILGYKYISDIPISLPPAWDWYDSDITMNIMAQTARVQAESQKNLIVADPRAKEAAEAALASKNMNVVIAQGMDAVKTYQFGGVAPENYQWMMFAEAEFTKSGIPADVLRGVGAEAQTLGQEQLIFSNATRIVNNFYNRFHAWMTSILEKWSWAVGQTPNTYVEILDKVKIPGLNDYEMPVYFTSKEKSADFDSFILKVIPYSTQRTSPELMYQRLYQFMVSWIIPTMQFRMQQGSMIDFAAVDKLLADYGGFENFAAWYKTVIPQEMDNVNFIMKSSKNTGQSNDKGGALLSSRMANKTQQQERTTGSPEGMEGQTLSNLMPEK